MEEFLHFPVKYVAGGEKISENIGIGGGERERESKDYAASCGRLAMGDFRFPEVC